MEEIDRHKLYAAYLLLLTKIGPFPHLPMRNATRSVFAGISALMINNLSPRAARATMTREEYIRKYLDTKKLADVKAWMRANPSSLNLSEGTKRGIKLKNRPRGKP